MNDPAINPFDVQNGVFLDVGSVDGGDLDRARLRTSLSGWTWHEFTEPAETAKRIREADVIVSNKCMLDANALAGARQLKLIVVAATGTNNVDLYAAEQMGITVCNTRDYATNSLVQHVITMMLNLLTGQPFYRQRVSAGDWSRARQFSLFDRPIREATGLNLGVFGYGVLGKAVAEKARSMGMGILASERRGATPRPGRLDFRQVVAHADVLSLHCPLTADTRNLFDRQVMYAMKPGAILINTARGGLVNEQDLADCLREGVVGGAGVDTLTQEPPPPDHPLLANDIPNLIVTPHNAWASKTARQALLDQVAVTIKGFQRGERINRVKPLA
jgi:glycerate dehydrogenase